MIDTKPEPSTLNDRHSNDRHSNDKHSSDKHSSDPKRLFKAGFPTLLNISLFLLLAEIVVFFPHIKTVGLIAWAVLFGGFQILTSRIEASSPQRVVLMSLLGGLLIGLGPMVFLYIETVTQLWIVPSVLLVLCACSLPLLGNYVPAITGFTLSAIIPLTTALWHLDETLPMVWPGCLLALGAVIIWVSCFCDKHSL